KFFYDQDLKTKLDDRLPKLKDIQFHAKLGTLHDKVQRMSAIAQKLASEFSADPRLAARAVELCKADLVTGMVGEFPELQGIIGRYYALVQGEDSSVASAIEQHYWPIGANAQTPAMPVSIALALADKFDTLNEFFRIDEKPTGSKDPYALRRAALGIIRILIENDIQLSLLQFVRPDVLEFIKDRLQVALRERGIAHDRVKACLTDSDNVTLIAARAQALHDLLSGQIGVALLATYVRAANILKAEEKKDGIAYHAPVRSDQLVEAVEKDLAAALAAAGLQLDTALAAQDYGKAAAALAALQPYLAAFFDKVMVNAEDAAVRTNRLNLLGQIRNVCHKFADFSQIEG
ncbi:MAG TPA: glycine--tRNA ligase subunit beta, partial [Rhodospirillaceae bacterium]|nr:glycine--tRNA ligase subunit beta [Rhodospirillaceae bacterium]